MAEAGLPMSEPLLLGVTVSLESTLSAQSPSATSKSSMQVKQEEPKQAISEISAPHPTKEMNFSSVRVRGEPGEQEQSLSEHCVRPKASGRPHSLTEMHTPSHHHKITVNAPRDTPQAGRSVQSIKSAALPVHRSHSDASPLAKQAAYPPRTPDSQTCVLAHHGGDRSFQEAKSHSMLACKQPMQLQHCNIVTTVCRGASSGEGGAQQPQSRCVCSMSPKAAVKVDLNTKCDKVLCYGSYVHHANLEDMFAAYCHPQPIPAPSQLLPCLPGVDASCDMQRTPAPPVATDHLTLPRLISSVSETGLDAKHLLRCCNLSCSLVNPLPLVPGTPKNFSGEECCRQARTGQARTVTRDMGTMTTHKEVRDVGVQAGEENKSITPHVFPQICLAEESKTETYSQTPHTDSYGGKKPGGAPKSPVKEVKWDAEGMTWEVYGAAVDPEELGLAIQRHLELQIKETASRAAKLSRQNTNTSRHSGNAACQKKRSRIMGSIRTPTCCASTTTAVD